MIHIDLKRIALDKALRVKVRVKLAGIPIGVKASGGILDQVLREVEIECLPADIPATSPWTSAIWRCSALRVSDLPHSDKIKYLNTEDATVAHVVSIREEVPPWPRSMQPLLPPRRPPQPREPEVAKKGKPEEAAKKADAGARRSPALGRRSKPCRRSKLAGSRALARPLSGGGAGQSRAWSICGPRTTRGSWPSTASPSKKGLWSRTGDAGPLPQPAAWRGARWSWPSRRHL